MKTARRLLEEDRIVEYTEFMEQYPEYASLEREYLEKYVILEESVEETEYKAMSERVWENIKKEIDKQDE
ncbi:MAG: hypothetical protein ACLTLQ_14270 [[Clostridium] scindens]|nr:hypothetical protein [[Clostridium] scindens]MCB6890305.1 hypothetical protein [[Clostridium] scindens]